GVREFRVCSDAATRRRVVPSAAIQNPWPQCINESSPLSRKFPAERSPPTAPSHVPQDTPELRGRWPGPCTVPSGWPGIGSWELLAKLNCAETLLLNSGSVLKGRASRSADGA